METGGKYCLFKKPKEIIILILLWLGLSAIFAAWGGYSLSIVMNIPTWALEEMLLSVLHFGYIMSAIVWFVFSLLFIILANGIFNGKHWVWTTCLIISTIFLVVFGLMLISFMITAVVYPNIFSVLGLTTTILSFLIDLGIVFYLTRRATKIYFKEI